METTCSTVTPFTGTRPVRSRSSALRSPVPPRRTNPGALRRAAQLSPFAACSMSQQHSSQVQASEASYRYPSANPEISSSEQCTEQAVQAAGSRRRQVVCGAASLFALAIAGPAQAKYQPPEGPPAFNIQAARERGEAAREELAETETPGELREFPSGVKYREVLEGRGAGPRAAPGALVELRYTVYRLSSGAYFKESSGGKPVYLFSLGYGKEGKDDLNAVYRFELGAKGTLPSGVLPMIIGMQQGEIRRTLVPAKYGWGYDERVKPEPDTFGAQRRLANHRTEPLLFEAEMVRVQPPAGTQPPAETDFEQIAASLLPPDYNRQIERPPPPALSYNSIVYVDKSKR